MARIGVIGGSGVYQLLRGGREEKVATPFGDVVVTLGKIGDQEAAFIPRHGKKHSVPPFLVNYRGNLFALGALGVGRVIATNAVGSLREDLPPGTLVIPDDLIDMTKDRKYTFYDGNVEMTVDGRKVGGVVHVSMTPSTYCPEIRDSILRAGEKLALSPHDGGVYVCTEGNRYETAAEIRAIKILGADVVGMTGSPEATLARELAICYATIAVVTNFAAGLKTRAKLTHEEVSRTFSRRIEDVRALIKDAISLIPVERRCPCKDALEE